MKDDFVQNLVCLEIEKNLVGYTNLKSVSKSEIARWDELQISP